MKHTQCAEPDCFRPPAAWSYYCKLHRQRRRRTGSPTGRLLRGHEVRPYAEEIAPILDRYADHPSVRAALTYLDDLLQGRGQTSREEQFWLSRAAAGGATARDSLIALLAVWGATKYLKLEDGAALDAGLGIALCRLVPAPKRGRYPGGQVRSLRPEGSTYKPLGRRVRDSLGPLLARLWDLYAAEERRSWEIRRSLTADAVATIGKTVYQP